jgi:hypothetical protein
LEHAQGKVAQDAEENGIFQNVLEFSSSNIQQNSKGTNS